MVNEQDKVYYAIRTNGNILPLRFPDQAVAESEKSRMVSEGMIPTGASVVPVDYQGRQVLLG